MRFDKSSFILYDKKSLLSKIAIYPGRRIMNNEGLIKRIGRRVKEQREKLSLKQTELAKLVSGKRGKKTDYSYIGKIERGKQYPSLKYLKELADAFSIDMEYFFVDGKGAVEIEKVKEGLALLEKFEELNSEDSEAIRGLIEKLAFLGKVKRLNPQDREFVECLIKRLKE